MEAHGGRIWAESEGLGMGARFTFTAPAVEDEAAGPVSRTARSRKREREQARILVVDDHPRALRYVRDALSEAGLSAAGDRRPGGA